MLRHRWRTIMDELATGPVVVFRPAEEENSFLSPNLERQFRPALRFEADEGDVHWDLSVDAEALEYDAVGFSYVYEAFSMTVEAYGSWECPSIVVYCGASSTVLAPYDGGIDVFSKNEEEQKDVANRFQDWLSPRADGL